MAEDQAQGPATGIVITRLAGKLFTRLFVIFGVSVLLAGASGSFAAWFFFREYQSFDSLGADVLASLLKMGITCSVALLVVFLFCFFSETWPSLVEQRESPHVRAARIGGWRVLLGLTLTVLPLGLLPSLASTGAFVRENWALGLDTLGGLLLMVPLLEFATTLAVIMGSAGLALLLFAQSRTFSNEFVTFILIYLGLVLGHFHVVELMQRLMQPFPEVPRLIQDHNAVVQKGALHHAWLFAVYAAWVPFLIYLERARGTDRARASPRADPVVANDVSPASTAPSGPPPRITTVDWAQIDRRFKHSKYALRPKIGLAPSRGAFTQVYSVDEGTLVFSSRTNLFIFGTIRLYAAADAQDEVSEILLINRKGILLAEFEVIDPTTKEKIAAVMRKLGVGWRLLDPHGREIGFAERVGDSLGSATYQVDVGGVRVATFVWSYVLVPELLVDFSEDVNHLLDRRLGIAQALILYINNLRFV